MQNVACDLETGDAHLQIGAIVCAKSFPPPLLWGVFNFIGGRGKDFGGLRFILSAPRLGKKKDTIFNC